MITISIIIITSLISIAAFNNKDIMYKLALNPYSMIRRKQWYRAVTCSFVHADFSHLLVNMFVLWSFGSNVEASFSYFAVEGLIVTPMLSFFILYFGGVLFSSIPDIMGNKKNNPMYNSIGASGGVSAILFASILLSPLSMLSLFLFIPIPKIVFGVGYLAYSHYMDKRSRGNVNHKAHIYGAMFGVFYMILLNYKFAINFINELFSFL